jgi:hypothetical protein
MPKKTCLGRCRQHIPKLYSLHVLGFGPFFVLDNLKLNSLAFRQRLESITLNSGKVNENVRPALLLNEAEPLLLIEPFYSATRHVLLTSSGYYDWEIS